MEATTNCVVIVFVYYLQFGERRTGFVTEEETFARKNEDTPSFYDDFLCHRRRPPSSTLQTALYGDYQSPSSERSVSSSRRSGER